MWASTQQVRHREGDFLQQTEMFIFPIWQMRKLRHRELRDLGTNRLQTPGVRAAPCPPPPTLTEPGPRKFPACLSSVPAFSCELSCDSHPSALLGRKLHAAENLSPQCHQCPKCPGHSGEDKAFLNIHDNQSSKAWRLMWMNTDSQNQYV